jgi:DNA phosphorothioation-associated putative methyltransferase
LNKEDTLNSEKTAMSRKGPSAPTKALFEDNPWKPISYLPEPWILDYGCGKGADVDYLLSLGYRIHGYDPHFQPLLHNIKYDVIVCNYVLNTISHTARTIVLQDIVSRLSHKGVAFISVRSDKINGTPHEDGVITKKKTFQKSFTEKDLLELTNGELIFSNKNYITVKVTAENFKPKTLP